MKSPRGLLACALIALIAPCAFGQTPTHTITYSDGLLSVRADRAPLAEIFDNLVRQGIVEVTGSERLIGLVSIDMQANPVDVVVKALLADYNFVVTTRPAQPYPVTKVLVHSRSDGAPPPVGPIPIPVLQAVRAADQQAAMPDPVDPDEEPDPDAEADRLQEEADRVEEEVVRAAELAERERSGAFDPDVPVVDLAELLDEDNPLIRVRAFTELNSRSQAAAIAHLIKGLGDDDVMVRYHVVDLMGRRADAVSLKQLGELLRNEDTAVRYGAFMALAMRADPASASFVEAVADDGDPIIKEAGAAFLREMARRARPLPPSAAPQRQ